MALFNFDARGYVFQSGIDTLLAAYSSAARALTEDIAKIDAESAAYEEGGEWIGEREDGYVLWEQSQIFEMQRDMALEALADLRKAFSLAAYHHWERSARKWTGDHSSSHDDLAMKVSKIEIAIHPRLSAIRDLANTLKHNSLKFGPALVSSWPAVLPSGFTKPGYGDWYGSVTLNEDHITEVFNIVAASGPTATG